jgi:outer membrane protein assembly factor BamB
MRRRHFVPRVMVVVTAVTVLAAGCDWTTFRGGPEHSGSVGEVTLNTGNVSGVQPAWTTLHPTNRGAVFGQPVVAEGLLYTTVGARVFAYDPAGCNVSAGCAPLWTAEVLPPGPRVSAPTVADGVLYVSGGGQLFTFDAAGVTNCQSGTPRTCEPLWSAVNHSVWTPTVAGGVVYTVGGSLLGGEVLMAFDATGVARCSGTPKVCLPLWRANPGLARAESVPTVAHGRVFVGSTDGHVRVFDAAGTASCSGVPKVCQPLAILTTGIATGEQLTVPAVHAGWLYVATPTSLQAFDADGFEGCTGSPPVCSPLWTAPVPVAEGFAVRPPAIHRGVVYVSRVVVDAGAGFVHDIVGVDADGKSGCSGTPTVCQPVWSTAPFTTPQLEAEQSGPTLANGVVYATNADIGGCGEFEECNVRQRVLAWDAAGTDGCTGAPPRCAPLLDVTLSDTQAVPRLVDVFEPVIANSRVYVADATTAHIIALDLPSA